MKPITEETVSGLMERCDITERQPGHDAPKSARILPFRLRSRPDFVATGKEAAPSSRRRTSKGFFFYSTEG